MNHLYPPGLYENRAVDDLYSASWMYSEITLLYWKIFCTVQYSRLIRCSLQNFSDSVANSSEVYKFFFAAVAFFRHLKQVKRIKFRQIRPRQEHTKGPLTGKKICWLVTCSDEPTNIHDSV